MQIERTTIEPGKVTAFSGTGFDPDNPQHVEGSDAVRYAIWIQQARDAGDYQRADEVRRMATRFYEVLQEKDSTTVLVKDIDPGPVVDGILFDALTWGARIIAHIPCKASQNASQA